MKSPDTEQKLEIDLDFDMESAEKTPSWRESLPITLWLGPGYSDRFKALQGKSNKKFGKHLKTLVEMAIDKVDQRKSS